MICRQHNKQKIGVIILVVLIVVINMLTVIMLVHRHYVSVHQPAIEYDEIKSILQIPSTIRIVDQDRQLTLSQDNELYEILCKRTQERWSTHHDIECSSIENMPDEVDSYLDFVCNGKTELSLRVGNDNIIHYAEHLYFPLTGEYATSIIIDNCFLLTGILQTDSELADYVQKLVANAINSDS